MDTIFAQCSGHGKAGIAVFRISGPLSYKALKKLAFNDELKFNSRTIYLQKLYTPLTQELIDEAMAVYFKQGASFTGEEIVEIYVHGSIAVIRMLNMALMQIEGLRLAQPGEFAKRAFLNGRFDLTTAEGLADLLDAETELQHKQAIRQLGGGLEQLYEEWRQQLLQLIGLLEAYIDFPDEDLPIELIDNANNLVRDLINKIEDHLNDNHRGERLRNGLKLAIIGPPNAGKSSLINLLMQREIAIVSNIPGTTRDVIEGHLNIAGYPIIVQDTAGIREDSIDVIENQGIEKAKIIAKNSDIKILILDVSKTIGDNEYFFSLIDQNTILLLNKIDLVDENQLPNFIKEIPNIKISIKEKIGLKQIFNQIEILAKNLASPSEAPQITRARHRVQLESALDALKTFSLDSDIVLAAEDIRITIRSLSNITGRITVDEILGEIFSNFCIGK